MTDDKKINKTNSTFFPKTNKTVSLNESSLSKEKSQRKIFLVKAKWVVFDEDKNSKCVEITSEELSVIKFALKDWQLYLKKNSTDEFDDFYIKTTEALLKKLSSFSEGFGEEEAPKSSLEELK